MNHDRLIVELVADEGLRLKPYVDCCGKSWKACSCAQKGNLTIGVGRNLDAKGISRGEALLLLEHDIEEVEVGLDANLSWWRSLSDARQRVLANMGFNLGVPKLLTFKRTLGFVKAGDYAAAAGAMLQSLWARQVKGRAQRLASLMVKGDESEVR